MHRPAIVRGMVVLSVLALLVAFAVNSTYSYVTCCRDRLQFAAGLIASTLHFPEFP